MKGFHYREITEGIAEADSVELNGWRNGARRTLLSERKSMHQWVVREGALRSYDRFNEWYSRGCTNLTNN